MKKITFFALLLFVATGLTAQTNYFVSTSGNDAGSGTLADPWLTIQYGLDELSAGDTLNVLTGTYNEKLYIPISGIFLRNHAGNSPVIDATGIANPTSIIEIYDVSDITIDGFELMNNIMLDAQGIVVENDCQNITIQNCTIHDIHFSSNSSDPVDANTNAQGIIVYGSDGSNAISNLKILNNEVYDCRLGYSEGIAVNGNVDGFEIIGNTVHDLTNIGIDVIGHEGTSSSAANDQARNGLIKGNTVYNCVAYYASSAGIYVDGGKDLIIENNTTYGNSFGIEVGCENLGKSAKNVTVRNNLVYGNEQVGIAMGGYDYPTGSGKVINSAVRNNTLYRNDASHEGSGELYLSYTENCTVENNIMVTSEYAYMIYQQGTPVGLTIDYNLYYGEAGASIEFDYDGASYYDLPTFVTGTGQDANTQYADPQFVDDTLVNPDFHILPTSPAVDGGNPAFTPAAEEEDLDGESRTIGSVDCGADEYSPWTGITTLEETTALRLYPNPAKQWVYVDATVGQYRFINLTGQTVLEGSLSHGGQRIDVSQLPIGMYLFDLNSSGVRQVERLVME
jgi:hypothetical protein